MEKRIIITGGAGFIGSNLVRHLLGNGHWILNLDKLTYAGNLASLSDCSSHPHYAFQQLDLVDGESVAKAIRSFEPNAIMHLAAESHVDRSIDTPEQFIQTNVLGTFQLLDHACQYWRSLSEPAKSDFRFVHVSTDEVYGSLGSTGFFTEQSPYDPHSPYSASKAGADHLARAWYHTYGLPVLITNCSNNYGPYQFPEKLIPVIILKALKNEPIPVYGQGSNIRDWLYVLDHCRALEGVLDRGRCGETYVIGGHHEMTNLQVVKTICQILDDERPRASGSYGDLITFVADRPGHDQRYAIDPSKVEREVGWKASVNPPQGFRDTVLWYLENTAWWQAILDGSYRLERQGCWE